MRFVDVQTCVDDMQSVNDSVVRLRDFLSYIGNVNLVEERAGKSNYRLLDHTYKLCVKI